MLLFRRRIKNLILLFTVLVSLKASCALPNPAFDISVPTPVGRSDSSSFTSADAPVFNSDNRGDSEPKSESKPTLFNTDEQNVLTTGKSRGETELFNPYSWQPRHVHIAYGSEYDVDLRNVYMKT